MFEIEYLHFSFHFISFSNSKKMSNQLLIFSAAVAFCWYLYVRRATLEKSPEKKEQVLAEVQKLLLKHRSVRKKLWNQANIRQYYDSLVRKNNTSSSNDQASGKRNE